MKLSLCGAAIAVLFAVPHAPLVTLSPGTLTFNAPAVGPAPTPQTLTLSNGAGSAGAKINWAAKASDPWLNVEPTSGSLNKGASTTLTVSIVLTGLTAGDYTGTVTVSDPGASPAYSPQTCTVTLHVLAGPKVSVDPTSISWTVPSGTASAPGQPVTVKNVGGASLSWTGSSDVPWLTADTASGTLGPGAFQTVTLSVDFTKQSSIGTFVGHWTPTSAQDPSAPSVTATLTISAVPVIGLSTNSLTFDVPQGSNPPAGSVTLSNNGTGSLVWQLTQDSTAPWLAVSPTSGSLASGAKQTLNFAVTSSGLAEGTYLASIPITATGASNTPQSISVTLNVNATPKIGVSPTSLNFAVSQDHAISSAAAVSITNTGAGTLLWSPSCPDSWLSVSPSGGSLPGLASEPILVSAVGAGLPPGTYTTILEIAGTDGSTGSPAQNSPQTIAVSLTVGPSDKPTDAPAGQCGLLGVELLVPALLAGALGRRITRRIRP